MTHFNEDEKLYMAEQAAADAEADRAYEALLPKISLSAYPQRIAQVGQQINQIDFEIAIAKRAIAAFEFGVDSVVAFDVTLKNETTRGVRRYELLTSNTGYAEQISILMAKTKQRADLLTEQERLKGEFSVAKLEARARIAEQLSDLDARELVGV